MAAAAEPVERPDTEDGDMCGDRDPVDVEGLGGIRWESIVICCGGALVGNPLALRAPTGSGGRPHAPGSMYGA